MTLTQRIIGTNLCNEILLPSPSNWATPITLTLKWAPSPKYKFSRAKWYVAEFNIADYTDVVHWCTEHFGPHPMYPDAWSRWEHRYENKIHFRDEKDYNWFVLRWSA